MADNHFRSAPDGGNPNFFPVYDTDPEIVHMPESRLGDNQKELDPNAGLEPSKGKIWGMERKTFVIVLVVFVILIIAVAAGVGWGVAATTAKSKDSKIVSLVSESTPTHSSYAPQNYRIRISLVKVLTGRQNNQLPTPSGDHATLVTVISSISSISSSPVPTSIRKNTPLAAVNWNVNNVQVFYKLEDGSIRYRENYGSGWGGGSPQITNLKPRDDSGLAVIGWLDNNNVEQVCTVFITPPLSF